MLLWSYFSVVSTDPGGVPLNWKPMVDEEKGDVDPLLGSEHTGVGLGVDQENMVANPASEAVRFCRKCNLFKPPRCHHCSVCEFFVSILFTKASSPFVLRFFYRHWIVKQEIDGF